MVNITIAYEGDLRCTAIHSPSKSVLQTDAPVDNKGKGESFSPTDLVATALGTCVATIMGIYAREHGIDLSGMKLEVQKIMQENPRRIGKLHTKISLPASLEAKQRKALETAAKHCPVHKSLHPDIEIIMDFEYC
ncbi:MAG: OsmC family protein [Candidatus Brocadiae bacterium]|nr:OsmC family protein [Candidatus Brocadiia bacterium]